LERKKNQREADCGTSSPALFEKHDPLGCSLRTRLLCECEAATGFVKTWKQWDTPGRRLWWVLTTLEPPTEESGSGFSEGQIIFVWDRGTGSQQEPMIGCVVYENGDMIDVELPDGTVDCFPVEWIHWLPTPQSADWRSGKGYNHGGKKQTPQMRHIIYGSLNPDWTMWLMGFPTEYADELTRLCCEWSETHGATPSR